MPGQAKENFLKIQKEQQNARNGLTWLHNDKPLSISLYQNLLNGDFISAASLLSLSGEHAVSVDASILWGSRTRAPFHSTQEKVVTDHSSHPYHQISYQYKFYPIHWAIIHADENNTSHVAVIKTILEKNITYPALQSESPYALAVHLEKNKLATFIKRTEAEITLKNAPDEDARNMLNQCQIDTEAAIKDATAKATLMRESAKTQASTITQKAKEESDKIIQVAQQAQTASVEKATKTLASAQETASKTMRDAEENAINLKEKAINEARSITEKCATEISQRHADTEQSRRTILKSFGITPSEETQNNDDIGYLKTFKDHYENVKNAYIVDFVNEKDKSMHPSRLAGIYTPSRHNFDSVSKITAHIAKKNGAPSATERSYREVLADINSAEYKLRLALFKTKNEIHQIQNITTELSDIEKILVDAYYHMHPEMNSKAASAPIEAVVVTTAEFK